MGVGVAACIESATPKMDLRVAAFRANFDEVGVLITRFDDEGSWSRALLRVLEDVHARVDTQTELDFIVVCALEEERAGFTRMKRDSYRHSRGLPLHR
jgi:hypothetical protein